MKAQIISFQCILKNKFGRILSSTVNRDIMTQTEGGGLLTALAEGLQDLQQGERRSIALRAEQAYGFYDPKMAVTRSKEELGGGEGLKVGDQVPLRAGGAKTTLFRVVGMNAESVFFDANHPLAGQDLVFEIEALAAREATPEEISESSGTVDALLH